MALVYDQAINWEQRLAQELPFLLSLLKRKKNARVLDLACGTGRHAVAFASAGFEVVGLDLSSQMIDAAKAHMKENGVTVQFHVADMVHASDTVQGPFDLILCLGNSLALLPSAPALQQTITSSFSLLKKEGQLVTQTLNFEEIRNSNFRFFPLKSGKISSDTEVIFVRFFEPVKNTTTAQLVFTGFFKTKRSWETKIYTQKVLQLSKPLLQRELQAVGFKWLKFYADYAQEPFLQMKSRNLIILARK